MKDGVNIHSPENFNPGDYSVVDYLDNRRPEYCGQSVEDFKAAGELMKHYIETAD